MNTYEYPVEYVYVVISDFSNVEAVYKSEGDAILHCSKYKEDHGLDCSYYKTEIL